MLYLSQQEGLAHAPRCELFLVQETIHEEHTLLVHLTCCDAWCVSCHSCVISFIIVFLVFTIMVQFRVLQYFTERVDGWDMKTALPVCVRKKRHVNNLENTEKWAHGSY